VPSLEDTVGRLLLLPREAGTPQSALARDLVSAHLQSLGYHVTVQKFSFSPASLRAFPLFGDGLGLLALVLLPLLASPAVPGWAALLTWAGGVTLVAVVAGGIGLGWVPLGEPPREDANLIATRGPTRPRRWVVAHLDSKAQGHSMAGRLLAVWLTGLAIIVLGLGTVARLSGPVPLIWAASGAALGLMAGYLARRGRLEGGSRGARDNGSGIIALLAAAESSRDGLGFLITGAEEFGLVGARVFVRLAPDLAASEFINLDTIDDEGNVYLVSHDANGARLAQSVEPALQDLGAPVRRRRLPLGIFVDSAALARAGAPAITIGRLTWNTLRRIHTAADTPEGLSFCIAKAVGRAIALN